MNWILIEGIFNKGVVIEREVVGFSRLRRLTTSIIYNYFYYIHRSDFGYHTLPYPTLLEHLSFLFNNDSSATLSLRTTRDYRATKSPFNQPYHGHGHTTSQTIQFSPNQKTSRQHRRNGRPKHPQPLNPTLHNRHPARDLLPPLGPPHNAPDALALLQPQHRRHQPHPLAAPPKFPISPQRPPLAPRRPLRPLQRDRPL